MNITVEVIYAERRTTLKNYEPTVTRYIGRENLKLPTNNPITVRLHRTLWSMYAHKHYNILYILILYI